VKIGPEPVCRIENKRTGQSKSHKGVVFHLVGEKTSPSQCAPKLAWWLLSPMWSCLQSLELKFSGVTILQAVEVSVFLLILAWALQQYAALMRCLWLFWLLTAQDPDASTSSWWGARSRWSEGVSTAWWQRWRPWQLYWWSCVITSRGSDLSHDIPCSIQRNAMRLAGWVLKMSRLSVVVQTVRQ